MLRSRSSIIVSCGAISRAQILVVRINGVRRNDPCRAGTPWLLSISRETLKGDGQVIRLETRGALALLRAVCVTMLTHACTAPSALLALCCLTLRT